MNKVKEWNNLWVYNIYSNKTHISKIVFICNMLVRVLAAGVPVLREALRRIKIKRWYICGNNKKWIQDVNDNDQIIVKNTEDITVSMP